ncbi:hypothetical protein GCM10009817_02790 [Terrabacter lapilli]|uniref:Uncharacterized protein n=1 Tax=Terrabacter lapilli TaxID=436231 RepID=A0ABN2RB58_9MICO
MPGTSERFTTTREISRELLVGTINAAVALVCPGPSGTGVIDPVIDPVVDPVVDSSVNRVGDWAGRLARNVDESPSAPCVEQAATDRRTTRPVAIDATTKRLAEFMGVIVSAGLEVPMAARRQGQALRF